MISLRRWWARASAALTAFVMTMLIPAVVWAESSGAAELARRRRSGGIGAFGFLGALCCLFVVGGIVLVVVLATRRGKRGQ